MLYPSMANMSAAVGIPLSILKAAKKDGCSFVEHSSRCDLGEFLRWYFNRNLTDDERENWTSRGKRAIALLNEHKLEREKQSSLDRTLVMQLLTDVIGNCIAGELERFAQEWPASLKGKTETEIHAAVKRDTATMREKMFSRINHWKNETGVDELVPAK